MSQKANPTLIGAFVLGALVLVVGGLALFGGGRFFTETVTYVAFFDEAIGGLSSGSPVNFRGVKVGEVGDIQVLVDSQDFSVRIPVYLKLQRRKIRAATGGDSEGDILQGLILQGLRAQLQTSSLVTGQLQIELDFAPDQPPVYLHATTEFPEMPTIPSTVARLRETIESLSLEELVANAQQVLVGLNQFINSPDLSGALKGLNQGIRDLQDLVAAANSQIDPLVQRFDQTMDQADVTLESLQQTLAVARDVLGTADESLSIAGEQSPLRYELIRTLDELSSAARALRSLAEYLERNPDALLRGKPGELPRG